MQTEFGITCHESTLKIRVKIGMCSQNIKATYEETANEVQHESPLLRHDVIRHSAVQRDAKEYVSTQFNTAALLPP